MLVHNPIFQEIYICKEGETELKRLRKKEKPRGNCLNVSCHIKMKRKAVIAFIRWYSNISTKQNIYILPGVLTPPHCSGQIIISYDTGHNFQVILP